MPWFNLEFRLEGRRQVRIEADSKKEAEEKYEAGLFNPKSVDDTYNVEELLDVEQED